MTGVAREVQTRRDVALDLMRGVAIVFVIINHIQQPSLWHVVTVERVGLVTGAEVFVLVSGIVLGMVHRRRVATAGWASSARILLRRSLTLYLTSVAVIVTVFLLRYVPGLDNSSLSTYTDGSGTVYDLYERSNEPLRFLRGVLLLIYGPGEFNIMGLYVVLLAVAPLGTYLLVKGMWPLLLLLSGSGYVAVQLGVGRLLPSQFENSFLLLAWQFLFFLGLVVGFHRDGIRALLTPPVRKAVVAVSAVLTLALCLLALSSPWADVPGPRLPLISAERFADIYLPLFFRHSLDPGRLLNVLVLCISVYAFLSWRPAILKNNVAGVVMSLGRATLYVFVVHLAFVLLVDNVSGGQRRGLIFGTLAGTFVLVAIAVMVRKRMLFRVIPR